MVSKLFAFYILTIFAFCNVGHSQVEIENAELVTTPEADRRFSLASTYRVELHFRAPQPDRVQLQETRIEARNVITTALVPIDIALVTGGFREPGEAQKFRGVHLYGPFRSDSPYVITVQNPDGSTQAIQVQPIQERYDPLQWFTNHSSLLLKPAVTDATNIGTAYTYNLFMPGVIPFLDLRLTSEGDFGTGGVGSGFTNTLSANLNFRYQLQPEITLDLGSSSSGVRDLRTYVYPFAFRFSPVGFESNFDFSDVDFSIQADVIAAVPYSDLPILLLHRQLDVHRSFYPMSISFGYSFSPSTNVAEGGMRHRLNGELLYDFPITNRVDIHSRYRTYLNLEDLSFESLVDLSLTYFLDENLTTGFEMTYLTGSPPPTFDPTSALRMGFSFRQF